ncbi:MAG: hypothetical protein M1282_05555 [Chloroflexi bacterium]|nr:hypothetical protein [Chloroflexota bacterium]
MTTIRLSKKELGVLSFKDNVLELFGSWRYHVSQITKLELKTDKKGNHTLDMYAEGDNYDLGNVVDEDAFPKVSQLITDVQKAQAEFKFD